MADEYPIGSIRIFKGRKLKVVEDAPASVCDQCCMDGGRDCHFPEGDALCYDREDGALIHYEEVVEDGDAAEEHY